MPTEASIIKQARARERRFIADIKAHPGPGQFESLITYLEDAILDLKELCAVRGLDFQRCARTYVDNVVSEWCRMKTGKTSAEQLRGILTAIVKVNY